MVITHVGPMSCAKIAGTVYAVLGLVIGCIFSAISLAAVSAANSPKQAGLAALGTLAVIVAPVVYGIMGFLFALFGAWIYNLLAKVVGGVKIETQ